MPFSYFSTTITKNKIMKKILFFLLAALSFTTLQAQFNVYIFVAEECPISIYMAQPLQDAIATHQDKATFYAVFPLKKSTSESAQQFLTQYQLTGYIPIIDNQQTLTKQLGATITPEVVITDKDNRILYRGRISNAYSAPGRMKHGPRINELKAALARLGRGEKPLEPWAEAVGCYITFIPKQ